MVGERVPFLFMNCEVSITNELVSEFVIPHNEWIESYKRTSHEVICLFYKYCGFFQTTWQKTEPLDDETNFIRSKASTFRFQNF